MIMELVSGQVEDGIPSDPPSSILVRLRHRKKRVGIVEDVQTGNKTGPLQGAFKMPLPAPFALVGIQTH